MKNKFKITLINILYSIILFLMLSGCAQAPPTKTDLYLYLDYTEGQRYENLAEDVDKYLALMQIDNDASPNFGTVRIVPIHDLGAARKATVKLKPGKSQLEGNRYLRQQEVLAFKTKLLEKINDLNAEYGGQALNSSQIFEPLRKGIKKLNTSDANHKVMVVYSDMLENSPLANFHQSGKNHKAMMAKFEAKKGLEDIDDIAIFIVHPVDKRNDAKIRASGDFWRTYFVQKGMDDEQFHFDTGIEL